jgi:uncharacterized protein (TIGR02270 family)
MTGPKATYIPELIVQHYEELQFLWGQRESALRSPRYTMREFSALEQRIEAHIEGMLVAGVDLIQFVEEGLTSDDPATTFAAAYSLLRLENETATLAVIQAFSAAPGKQMYGLRQALSHAQLEQILPAVPFLFFSSTSTTVAAAADVLACHGALPPPGLTIEHLLQDEDSAVRQTGWQVVANSGLSVDPRLYAAAVRDEEPAVRRAGLQAAAWNAVPDVLVLARQLAEEPRPDNLYALELLAILGGPEDLQRMTSIAKTKELGPGRFKVLGCFGHPALVELLLAELTNPDPQIAAAAGAAFTKVTGQDIDSKDRAKVPPQDGEKPDDFEAEFLEGVPVPSPELARTHWEKAKPRLAKATRVCKGFDLSRGATPGALAKLDMESRWEFFLRSKFTGAWSGSPVSLERFPQAPQR